jgi:hypothetical protein
MFANNATRDDPGREQEVSAEGVDTMRRYSGCWCCT